MIIPTYNRENFLRDTLESLTDQRMPPDRFDVIVVDDGSSDGTPTVQEVSYPFRLSYYRQPNQGDAVARNLGASKSDAALLVFLDDDIVVHSNYLACLDRAHQGASRQIVVGSETLWLQEKRPPFTAAPAVDRCSPLEPISFSVVCSNNMSIRRQDYHEIGPMDNLDFAGSSIWCDVDFAYRAQLQGYSFYRSPAARCWHRDYVALSLSNQKQRMWQAAFRAGALFQKFPELPAYLPMFEDKLPVDWQSDPARLILRKTLRKLASSGPALHTFETLVRWFDRPPGSPFRLAALKRWIVGGHIYRGYRSGQRALHPKDI